MPISKTKNEKFFKNWIPEMAYVLGFFTADGCMIKNRRGVHFIEFHITDKDLLEKIKKLLNSNHKITARKINKNWETSYRLQIGSKEIFNDLIKLGLTPNKSKTVNLPKVPKKYFSHFLRGYFDGDGNVAVCRYKRKARNNRLTTVLECGFTCGNKKFLEQLKEKLENIVKGGTLYYSGKAWRLYFSINDSRQLYKYMYKGLNQDNGLFLKRKKIVFEKYWGV